MKKYSAIILVAIIWLTQQNAKAQINMGMYGTHTNSVNSLASPDVGSSFSVRFLSIGDSIGAKKKTSPIIMQLGGELYFSGLGKKTFYDVPLLAPQMGYSKVTLTNSLWCVNAIARFSLPNKSIFTPYADVFAGYRGTRSNLHILPYVIDYQQSKTNQSLESVDGINYGMGAGILTSLGKHTKLDMGVSYAQAFQNGNIADLNTAYADANGINLNLKESPNGIMMVHVGLIFYLDKINLSISSGSGGGNYYPSYDTPAQSGGSVVGGSYYPPARNGGGWYTPPSNGGGTRSNGGNWGGGNGGGIRSGGGNWGGNGGGGSHVGVHIGGGGGHSTGHGK